MLAKIGIAVGLSLLVAGSWWWHLRQDAKLQAELVNAKATIATFAATNESNLMTIAHLELTNADWAAQCGGWEERETELEDLLAAERLARQQDRAAADRRLQEVLANDRDAEVWAAKPLPIGIADWVCEHIALSCES